jgi:hypothetical protein
MRTLAPVSNRMKVSILFDAMKCLDQRDRTVEAPPLACVPMPHHVETIGSQIIQTGERVLELRLVCIGRIEAESFNETIAAAMPFPVEIYGIIEFGWMDRGKKARLQDFGCEFIAGGNDRLLFTLRWHNANVLWRRNPSSPVHGTRLQHG